MLAKKPYPMKILLIVMLLCPLSSWGHSKLVTTEPANGVVLDTPPKLVTLNFNKPIEPKLHRAEVWSGGVWRVLPSEVGGNVLTIDLKESGSLSEYKIRWSVMSPDGHRQRGLLRFFVK
ncbi:copper resistance protein CopC [Methylobacillus caricis]|uniref:copper resistance CopC family protein n=1 Tax=Methylobacillus caricis TaxID=1971611 RepID=UPI001CFF9027|nr:copper resistance CopC family protein [Methylobacillus caricis]MCB5186634.1 copper resistance protein CopC [Methylobacillus caricis]